MGSINTSQVTRSRPSLGSTTGLDRHSGQRTDREWLSALLTSDQARVALLVDMKPVIRSDGDRSNSDVRWFTFEELRSFGLNPELGKDLTSGKGSGQISFLGSESGGGDFSYFAMALDRLAARNLPVEQGDAGPVVDLRSLAMQGAIAPRTLSLLGEARALAAWHGSHRCCGRCGSRNRVRDGGWRLACRSCGQVVFPRTDPVVIMLITDGERCLMAHERRYAENFYSCLAGFMEPGEDIEDAVRREVMEETSVRVGRVDYHSSQPWPFPHTLMIGCIGHAETTDIVIDPEIDDAIWMSRRDAELALESAHPDGLTVPGHHAIAHHLLRAFAAEEV